MRLFVAYILISFCFHVHFLPYCGFFALRRDTLLKAVEAKLVTRVCPRTVVPGTQILAEYLHKGHLISIPHILHIMPACSEQTPSPVQ